MAERKELDLEQITPGMEVQLAQRGRAQRAGGTTGAKGVGSGLRLDISNLLGEAAEKVAATPMLPVANPQVMHGMRLDPRTMGGQTFSALEDKIAQGERPGTEPVGEADRGRAGSSYPGDVSTGAGVYGAGTGDINYADYQGPMAGGGDLASQTMGRLAMTGLRSAGNLALGGLLSGASFKDVLSPAIGRGLTSLTGMGAINQLAGAVAASEIGTNVADRMAGAKSGMIGDSVVEEGTRGFKTAREQARLKASAPFGIAQMAAEGIGSLFTDKIKSPIEQAEGGFTRTQAEREYGALQKGAFGVAMDDRAMEGGPSIAQAQADLEAVGGGPSTMEKVKSAIPSIPSMTDMGFKTPTVTPGANVSTHVENMAKESLARETRKTEIEKELANIGPLVGKGHYETVAQQNRQKKQALEKELRALGGGTQTGGDSYSGLRPTGYDFYGQRSYSGGEGGYTGSGAGTGGGRGGEHESESGGYGGRGGV
jgi:hypothetical protein